MLEFQTLKTLMSIPMWVLAQHFQHRESLPRWVETENQSYQPKEVNVCRMLKMALTYISTGGRAEAADLVPYLLVGARSLGLFGIIARIVCCCIAISIITKIPHVKDAPNDD